MTRSIVGFVVAAIISCALAAPSAAQPAKQADGKKPPPADVDAARAKAKKVAAVAKRDYLLGKFSEALAGYKRAYDTYPAPGLLFNIGQCHSKLHNWDMAIFSYQAYLRERPKTPNRPVVEELLRDAQAAHDKAQRDAAAAKREKQRREREAEQRKQLAANRLVIPPPTPAPHAAPVYKRWWFWTAIGAVATSSVIIFAASGDTVVLPERSLGVLDRR